MYVSYKMTTKILCLNDLRRCLFSSGLHMQNELYGSLLSSENRTKYRMQLTQKESPSSGPALQMRRSAKKSRYSVLIPFLLNNGVPSILFELRPNDMKGHRGEVCFPGGKIEESENAEQSALRESWEEIGLDKADVEIWGQMSPFFTRNMKDTVTPILGFITKDYNLLHLKPQSSEVEEVFVHSIEAFCDPDNLAYTQFRVTKTSGYSIPIFLNSSPRIWGLTGMILHETLETLFPNLYKPKMKFIRPVAS